MKHLKRVGSLLLLLALVFTLVPGCENVDKVAEAAEIIQDIIDIAEIPSADNSSVDSLVVSTEEVPNASNDAEEAKGNSDDSSHEETASENAKIDENGAYTAKDDVALYIHTYGKLPKNFITKKEAQSKGWSGGSLEPYAPGCCIGGDHFGNYEGLLPERDGRKFTECDIDTLGASSRGAKRIIFSNDGLIYYTDDHYESFTLLYGEE